MRAYRVDILVLVACLALAPFAAAAQEPAAQTDPAPQPKLTQEIVRIEHADPQRLDEVLRVFDVEVYGYRDQGVLTIKGAPEDVALAAAAARRLDVAPAGTSGVEVTVHVLGASKEGELPGGVPEPLAEVAQQLRGVFGYQGVRLLDSLVLRARDRAAGQVAGTISVGVGERPIPYRFGFNRVSIVDGDGGREVRIDGLLFEAGVPMTDPDRTGSDQVRLVTDVDVREGQKAVVGKAATGAAGREGLVVVIEAKVLE